VSRWCFNLELSANIYDYYGKNLLFFIDLLSLFSQFLQVYIKQLHLETTQQEILLIQFDILMILFCKGFI